MSGQISSEKAAKLLGISDHKDKPLGSLFYNKGLDWFCQNSNIDIHLNKNEKCTVNITNKSYYETRISVLDTIGNINTKSIIHKKSLKFNDTLSLYFDGTHQKYSPILIQTNRNTSHGNDNKKYMIYIPYKTPSLEKQHYLTIYSPNIATIKRLVNTDNEYMKMWSKFKVYFNILHLDILLFILIIFTFLIGSISLVLATLTGTVLGKYILWTNHDDWLPKIEKIQTCEVLTLCIISYLYDNMLLDMSCDKLIGLTNLQFVVFNVVVLDYAVDLATDTSMDFDVLCHHILGWVGIVVFSSWNIAGGIITLLLFDAITFAVRYLGMSFSSVSFWIVFVLVRIIWYNYICFRGIRCVDDEYIWFKYGVIIWWIFANVFHTKLIYDHWDVIRIIINKIGFFLKKNVIRGQ